MITVDTHVIIWDALEPKSLSKRAITELHNANKNDGIIFCEISLWEIAMLISKQRLKIDVTFLEFIDLVSVSNKYIFQGITPEIAALSVELPKEINPNPADKIICATSIATKAPLLTADRNLLKSELAETIW